MVHTMDKIHRTFFITKIALHERPYVPTIYYISDRHPLSKGKNVQYVTNGIRVKLIKMPQTELLCFIYGQEIEKGAGLPLHSIIPPHSHALRAGAIKTCSMVELGRIQEVWGSEPDPNPQQQIPDPHPKKVSPPMHAPSPGCVPG